MDNISENKRIKKNIKIEIEILIFFYYNNNRKEVENEQTTN